MPVTLAGNRVSFPAAAVNAPVPNVLSPAVDVAGSSGNRAVRKAVHVVLAIAEAELSKNISASSVAIVALPCSEINPGKAVKPFSALFMRSAFTAEFVPLSANSSGQLSCNAILYIPVWFA
jgi:hypothetical protein